MNLTWSTSCVSWGSQLRNMSESKCASSRKSPFVLPLVRSRTAGWRNSWSSSKVVDCYTGFSKLLRPKINGRKFKFFCFFFLSYYGSSSGIPVTERLLGVGRSITPGWQEGVETWVPLPLESGACTFKNNKVGYFYFTRTCHYSKGPKHELKDDL